MENKEEKEVFRKEKGYACSITCHHEGVFTVKDNLGTPMFDFRVEDNAIVEVCDHSAYGVATKAGAEIVWDFIREKGILPEVDLEKVSPKQISSNLNRLGLALSREGVIYSLYDLPKIFETVKDVPYLEDVIILKGAKLPEMMTANDVTLDKAIKNLKVGSWCLTGKVFAKSF